MKVGSEEPVVVGQAETLRCALRVSPLRVPLMEGAVETEEEGHSDPAEEPEGDEDAHALLDESGDCVACAEPLSRVEVDAKGEAVVVDDVDAEAATLVDTDADAVAEGLPDRDAVGLPELVAVGLSEDVAEELDELVRLPVLVAEAEKLLVAEAVREAVEEQVTRSEDEPAGHSLGQPHAIGATEPPGQYEPAGHSTEVAVQEPAGQ